MCGWMPSIYGQLRQKQMLNMGGKTGAYDLVFAQEVWIPEYVSSGYLHALNDYLNDPALTGKDFDFSDFEQSLIQSDTIDGKLYEIGDRLKAVKAAGRVKS